MEQFTTPSTPEAWREVERKFATRWNYSHCCGALDGKHVEIKKPKKSGSTYYCYKGFFSIVLMALVDADYKFLWVHTGGKGSQSDCEIFNQTMLPSLTRDRMGLPPPAPLPYDDRPTPYFFVGDDAFPLRRYMMKPYSHRFLTHDERIFNYRTSRARRVVENGFGILAGRWRVLHTSMQVQPHIARKVTKASVVLHNILRDRNPRIPAAVLDREVDDQVVPGRWRRAGVLEDVEREGGRGPRCTRQGKELRAYLREYYNSDVGSVPWQEAALEHALN